MQSKAQVTLFVILGIVLLLSVTLILFIQQMTFQNKLEEQAKSSVNDFIELNSIHQYVTSCLDKVATEGLVLLGEQGGVIYDYQGGLTKTTSLLFREGGAYLPYNFTSTFLNESGELEETWHVRNVSFGIQNYISCPLFEPPFPAILTVPSTSYYPVKETRLSNFQSLYMNFQYGCFHNMYAQQYLGVSGFLGQNNIPRLCYYNGSNKKFENLSSSNPCEFRHYDTEENPTSIQHQLETYIKNNLGTCVDFSPFTDELTPFNITVIDNVSVSSIFQKPKGIRVKARYPFIVSIGNNHSLVEQVDFQTNIQINIRQIYDYVFQTVINMLRDPNYNLLKDWANVSLPNNQYYRPSFELDYERSPPFNYSNPYSYLDDVLTIRDKASLLKGKPYSFTFAIKQRKPVLDYLHNPIQYGYFGDKKIDYQFYTNSTISLSPKAIDPDYDNISFNYFGWKEDYDSWLNFSCCKDTTRLPNGCNLSNHQTCQVNVTNPKPHTWTGSPYFNSSNGYSEFDSNLSDVGYHEVTVLVTDEHGYKDFQIVHLLIFDLPIANLTGYNLYGDILNKFASIEDMYILNASNSTASILAGTNISHYIFRDALEGFHIFHNDSVLFLANDSYNFFNVTLGYFNYTNLHPKTSEEHEISLVVEQGSGGGLSIRSAPDFIYTNVSQCLPHGFDSNSAGVNNYPNATITTNDQAQDYYWKAGNSGKKLYELPHVCCEPFNSSLSSPNLEGGKFYISSTECFSIEADKFITCAPSNDIDEQYAYLAGALISYPNGVLVDANRTNYNLRYASPSNSYEKDLYAGKLNNELPLEYNNKLKNDLFGVKYEQKCSGDRGNVCSGRLSGKWSINESCADFDLSINQFARCQGPGVGGVPFGEENNNYNCSGKNILLDYSSPACMNFSAAHSFEKDVLKIQSSSSVAHADLIAKGYCAPSANVQAIDPQIQLACFGSCQSSTGKCAREDINSCFCNVTNVVINVCNGLNASLFFNESFETKDQFYCVSPNEACDEDCSPKGDASAEACYCQENDLTKKGPFSDNVLLEEENNTFFPNSPYQVLPSDASRCCSSSDKPTILVPVPNTVSGGGVCFEGQNFTSGTIFEDKHLLACNGNLLCCENSATCSQNYKGSTPVNFGSTSHCGHYCAGHHWS